MRKTLLKMTRVMLLHGSFFNLGCNTCTMWRGRMYNTRIHASRLTYVAWLLYVHYLLVPNLPIDRPEELRGCEELPGVRDGLPVRTVRSLEANNFRISTS